MIDERFHEMRRDTAGPRRIGSMIARLLSSSSYAGEQAAARLASAWEAAAPPAFRSRSRAGGVKRGVLDVVVSHSVLVQEMGFHKEEVVRRLGEMVPAEGITDIRCRVGDVS